MTTGSCPFCNPDPSRVFYEGELVIGLWDSFPVAPGHVLLIPKRHVPTWFDVTSEERLELIAAIDIARDHILARNKPDGFNLGVNIGEAAGQTIFHLHLHLIPRYIGDVADPTGGVRNVIPDKGNYLKSKPWETEDPPVKTEKRQLGDAIAEQLHKQHLICGGEDPLLPHLLVHLDSCERADMAVAFILRSGLNLLEEHLQDVLDRGGHIRLLTGDYLGITDPVALYRLVDLSEGAGGRFDLRVFESGGISFHPKAYIFYISGEPGSGVAYVGSSNLSAQALEDGIEWNYRVIPAQNSKGFDSVVDAFEGLFHHTKTKPLDHRWIQKYQQSRKPPCITAPAEAASDDTAEDAQQKWDKASPQPVPAEVIPEEPEAPPEPHWVQEQALQALQETRAAGNGAGLVVLATGLGKTWLAAFDSVNFQAKRVLFVAHREEILLQALKTFRRIRPKAKLGIVQRNGKGA